MNYGRKRFRFQHRPAGGVAAALAVLWLVPLGFSGCAPEAGSGGEEEPVTEPERESTLPPEEVVAYFDRDRREVLTFVGFSGSGYEDVAAMLAAAAGVLDRFDPASTVVNIGATAEGIGAVYELARERGFATTGIVSTRALSGTSALSPFVERVFYVEDESWGGLVEGTDRLSPVSRAMVEVSDRVVAIGGGSVGRDEFLAARRLGKPVEFFAAAKSRALAREKARRKELEPPSDLRGALELALEEDPGAPESIPGPS